MITAYLGYRIWHKDRVRWQESFEEWPERFGDKLPVKPWTYLEFRARVKSRPSAHDQRVFKSWAKVFWRGYA